MPGGEIGDAFADQGAQVEDEGHGDRVAGEVALLLALDDAGGGQDAELFGDICLFQVEALDDLGDGGRSALEELENAEARGLGEDGEKVGDGGELGGFEGAVCGRFFHGRRLDYITA